MRYRYWTTTDYRSAESYVHFYADWREVAAFVQLDEDNCDNPDFYGWVQIARYP